MPQQKPVGTTAIALGIVAVIMVVTVGAFVITNQVNPGGPSRAATSRSTTQSLSSTSTTNYAVTVCRFTTASNGSRVTTCSSPSVTATSTGVSTVCVITGQSGGAFLRVLSDSTQMPVTGAVVTATLNPAECILNGVEYTNTATTQMFTTNGTEWMLLNTTNAGSISLTVTYSGQTYTFTAELRPVSVTCTTLYVPSGRTNSTITFATSACP